MPKLNPTAFNRNLVERMPDRKIPNPGNFELYIYMLTASFQMSIFIETGDHFAKKSKNYEYCVPPPHSH